MNARLEKAAVVLTLAVIVLGFIAADKEIAFSATFGGDIDLFTQKDPYSGKGKDLRSDAFGPEEIAILYALATYNNVPLQNFLVAFQVTLPSNASFTLTTRTNSSGVAMVNFTIMTPPISINESDIFGEWHVVASILVESITYQDTMAFKVDWIVKLLAVRTIDENLTYRTYFGKGGDVGLEVTLRNIAMVLKRATLALVIYDELSVPINYTEAHDFDVQPNEKLVFVYFKLQIPLYAYTGNATVFVSALTCPANETGVAYCPPISADFFIRTPGPITVAFHDAALVDVASSANPVKLGEALNVSVLVRNEGTETEDFTFSVWFDDVLIGSRWVVALSPYFEAMFNFSIDTSVFDLGNRTIKASIPSLAREADLSDNIVYEGVEIVSATPLPVHNIAISNVTTSSATVCIGETVSVNVSVANIGTETESFNVSAYYRTSLIGIRQVDTLVPNSSIMLVFVWNTSLVGEGSYQISASAPLAADADLSDNTFVDGFVEVRAKPPPVLIHDVAVVAVTPFNSSVFSGDAVDVSVTVRNKGNYSESFDATLFYDSNVFGTLPVQNLGSDAAFTLVFHWNTESVATGNYTLSARAAQVVGEVNAGDNVFVDGVVEVKPKPPPPIHDVAVLSVVPSSSLVYIGDVLDVNVTVKNRGEATESFTVFLYYSGNVAATFQVDDLPVGGERNVTLHWDTNRVPKGNYTISGYAQPVLYEENTTDNTLEDGIVRVIPPPRRYFLPDWFNWFVLSLFALAVVFLIIWLAYRMKKKNEETFYEGWTAWYYCYDVRGKAAED